MRRARASDTCVARSESTHRDRLACAHRLRPRRPCKARVVVDRRASGVPPGAPGCAPHCSAQLELGRIGSLYNLAAADAYVAVCSMVHHRAEYARAT